MQIDVHNTAGEVVGQWSSTTPSGVSNRISR